MNNSQKDKIFPLNDQFFKKIHKYAKKKSSFFYDIYHFLMFSFIYHEKKCDFLILMINN